MSKIYIFGHRNPDTDSVTAAISLSYLKNKLGNDTEPAILSSINRETKFALDYFNVIVPKFLNDVKLKVKDVFYYKNYTINESDSIYTAFNKMEAKNISKIPIVDNNNKFLGVVTMNNISSFIMKETYYFDGTYDNILSVLKGKEVLKNNDNICGNIIFSNYNDNFINEINLVKENILITNNNNLIEKAVNKKVKLIIFTNNCSLSENNLSLLKKKKINTIITGYDFVKVIKLINFCNNASKIMTNNFVMFVNEYDDLTDFLKLASKVRLSYYIVIDNDGKCLGILRFSDIGYGNKKQVILVDHNSYAQSAIGIEETEILEIIDHHNLGSIGTNMPINFRNMPVGSTNTIIYNMYVENGIKIPYEIGGLMLSGILSDTLLLKSPTTTEMDKTVVKKLSKSMNIDYEKYGFELLKNGSSIKGKTKEEVLTNDFKTYPIEDMKIGISQVNTVNIREFDREKNSYIKLLNQYSKSNGYNFILMFVTDIIKNGSYVYYSNLAGEILKGAFSIDIKQGAFLPEIISRKKQILPKIMQEIQK